MSRQVCSQVIAAGGCLVLVPGLLPTGLLSSSGHSDTVVTDKLCQLLGFAEQIELEQTDELSVESLVARVLLDNNLSSESSATCAAVITYQQDFPLTADNANQSQNTATVMRADPAFQQIDMNNATLGNPLELDLTLDECIKLQHTLNTHFADDGIRFESKDPHRWYCHFDVLPQITCTPISAAISRDVARCRPRGDDSRQWRSKLAEIEMLLFEHPVNTERQQNNKLPVNTLWLWGEGSPPAAAIDKAARSKKVSVYTDNFYTQSVSKLTGVECTELPATAAAFTPTVGPALIVIDKFTHPDSLQTPHSEKLQWFDKVLCDQLWQQLKVTGFSEVAIWCGDNRLFHVSATVKKQLLRRLFYKPKPLSAFLPNKGRPVDLPMEPSPHPVRQRS